ncbi:MAG: hypothetical protein U0L06_02865 [Agathobacter sp.]|nr:hypothetical protein [Agathobacter sp.]
MKLSEILESMHEHIAEIAHYLKISDETVQYWIDHPDTMLDFGILEAGVISEVVGIRIAQFVEALVEEYPMETWTETKES